METFVNGYAAFVRSDVYAGGYTEDGERSEELAFYVVCENERGARWASRLSFTTEKMHRQVAEAKADAFCRKVVDALHAGADPAKSPKWAPTRPAYGSAAYSAADDLMDEARDLEAEGSWDDGARLRDKAMMMGAQ
jgi:hypothetical protein